jgi:signal transduction histidine kinase
MLALTFALAVASFSASTVVSEFVASGTRSASELIEHTLPDLESLAKVRTHLGKTEALLRALTEAEVSKERVEDFHDELTRSREVIRHDWSVYASGPIIPGEPELISAAESNMNDMDASVNRVVESVRRGDRLAAVREINTRALPAITATDEDVQAASDLNRRTATDAAERITTLRDASRRWSIILHSLSALLTVAAAYFVIRAVRRLWVLMGERLLELEHFAGRVAHDIRSPLGAVTVALDLATRQPEVTGKTQAYLERGIRTLQRVGQLVDGLLIFAMAGKPPPEPRGARQAGVREVLDGIVEDARTHAEEKGISLDYVSPSETLSVACSPGVLVSMASNFVTNAIKYMGDAPVKRVSVRAHAAGRSVRIEVSDTGPGVPPKVRPRLFEPYVRGADSTIPGLGLGLATVRRLAEAHGGSVGMQPNEACGSVFWFELPRYGEAQRVSVSERAVRAAKAVHAR